MIWYLVVMHGTSVIKSQDATRPFSILMNWKLAISSTTPITIIKLQREASLNTQEVHQSSVMPHNSYLALASPSPFFASAVKVIRPAKP